MRNFCLLAFAVAATGACAPTPATIATAPTPKADAKSDTTVAVYGAGALSTPNADPFPSTYKPFPSKPTVIRHATILTAAGPAIHDGTVYIRDGKIVAVGATVDAPADAVVVDGTGKFVTPGIIDVHSHIITNLGSQVPTRKRPPWSIEQSMSLMRWRRYRRAATDGPRLQNDIDELA